MAVPEGISESNRKIHGRLIEALEKNVLSTEPVKTENGTTTFKTRVFATHGERLNVIIGREGDVRFQTDSGKMIGVTIYPKQAEANYKSLIENQPFPTGLSNIKDSSGKPVNYKVNVHNGVVITSVDIGSKPIKIEQQGGKFTVPGHGKDITALETLRSVGDMVESAKPKASEQPQKPATVEDLNKLTAEHAKKANKLGELSKAVAVTSVDREVGFKEVDKIREIISGKPDGNNRGGGKSSGSSGASPLALAGGIALNAFPQFVEASQGKSPELPKKADRIRESIISIGGVPGYIANIAIETSKTATPNPEIGATLSPEQNIAVTRAAAEMRDKHGMKQAKSDVAPQPHITLKQTAQPQKGMNP